jgi:thiamine-monophosphate kinase
MAAGRDQPVSHLSLGPGREFERIRAIIAALGGHAAGLGDDCALVPLDNGDMLALSTDTSLEGTHFRRDWLSPEEIGWRAAAAALSDLAAEGAEVIGLLAALTLPGDASDTMVASIMTGMGACVGEVGGKVLGGDLTRGTSLSLTVTVVGRAARAVTRHGARPGDGIWVTGTLGSARAALAAWDSGREPRPTARIAFARPLPRIAAGRLLADLGATAMIDLSDGLAGDARHVAAASQVSLEIDLVKVPLGAGVSEAALAMQVPAAVFAAEGGEDYELLATLPPRSAARLKRATGEIGIPFTLIGSVRAGEGVRLHLDGTDVVLSGYDHFR